MQRHGMQLHKSERRAIAFSCIHSFFRSTLTRMTAATAAAATAAQMRTIHKIPLSASSFAPASAGRESSADSSEISAASDFGTEEISAEDSASEDVSSDGSWLSAGWEDGSAAELSDTELALDAGFEAVCAGLEEDSAGLEEEGWEEDAPPEGLSTGLASLEPEDVGADGSEDGSLSAGAEGSGWVAWPG